MPALIAILLVLAALTATASLAAQAASRTIYRCEREGVITFSDRPCDAAPAGYVPDSSRTSTYTPPPVRGPVTVERPARARPVRQSDDAQHSAGQAERCARLSQALGETRSRMRAGYTAAEGEKLRQRETKLRAQWRMEKCR